MVCEYTFTVGYNYAVSNIYNEKLRKNVYVLNNPLCKGRVSIEENMLYQYLYTNFHSDNIKVFSNFNSYINIKNIRPDMILEQRDEYGTIIFKEAWYYHGCISEFDNFPFSPFYPFHRFSIFPFFYLMFILQSTVI